ncbi:hypothetical protein OH76DRAFT_1423363 [Lentinus brumalis]|uniref:Uncharacterized protein n=1 Tax=Lentinus brumalis TaxID=2498619 RepID=A0A371CL76_9APHY|nr:hypothetical protein OH76DRAFT_1423363 [Polyporus brumalis]
MDKLGDLVTNPDLAYTKQQVMAKPIQAGPPPKDEDSSPCPSDDAADKPQPIERRRKAPERTKKSKAAMPIVMEDDEELAQLGDPGPSNQLKPPGPATQTRTRGGRRTRAVGRTVDFYKDDIAPSLPSTSAAVAVSEFAKV